MGYNIGPKIGIEGEQQFRKQIREINAEYKTLEAETRKVTAAFEANGDEQGKLEATTKQLQKHIDAQKQKMELLQDAVHKATVKYGENSIEANRLRGALYDTQATVMGLESELKDAQNQLNNTGTALEDLSDETDDAGNAVVDFGQLLEANLASDLIMNGLEKLGDLVKDFASGTIEAAAEVKAANSQFSQTFGNLEDTASEALENISDDTNIASTRMQKSYTRIFAFAKTVGTESEEALDIASRAMVAAADSAAYYDRSIEEVTETLQSFLKGNYENDSALGISATETSRNTKANELYAKSFQELSESQKVDVLLAMVEAGNEASGAIGQAARESDSWENVTGELSEAMKQLQAEAGKPALKKLTPIIEDITDGIYELIDDVDWDEFGDTVADVVDTFVDGGPDILQAISSVAAGFVAFEATKKAGELATMATSFLKIGTAATNASTAVATSGALAVASPWGIAAVAIGGVVGLVTSIAIEAEQSTSDLERSTERLQEAFDRAEESYAETTGEIEGAAFAAEYYIDRLAELEEAGLDNAVANREYELTVEKLNELIPDLNLVIDVQTGLVNQSTDAIRANIEAWQEKATAQALQDKFSDILKAQGEAEAELLDARVRMNELKEKELELGEKLSQKHKEFEKTTKKLKSAHDKLAGAKELDAEETVALMQSVADLEREQSKLGDEYMDIKYEVEENASLQEDLNSEITNASEVVSSYADDIDHAKETMALFNSQTEEAESLQDVLNQKLQNVQTEIDSLTTAYDEARAAAKESINSQIGLFDELAEESDWSAEKIVENWLKQQSAFKNYEANLQDAVDMGLDEALVQQLSDGSEESMQILHALVNDTEISIDDINAAFQGLDQSKEKVSTTIADIQKDFSDRMAAISEDAQKYGISIIDGVIQGVDWQIEDLYAKFEEAGFSIVDGIIEGVDYKKAALNECIENLSSGIVPTFNGPLKINSPSRAMEESGEFTVEGAILGVDNLIADYEAKMAELANSGRLAYLNNQLARAESYPDMYAPTLSTTNNTSYTRNYGGITFQIYTQPGQDENAIADAVYAKLQIEVDREGAGL